MPWKKAKLRGSEVFVRCHADGTPAAEGARVEIRFRPNDGKRYWASPRNLAASNSPVLPDETCAPAEDAPQRKTSEASSKVPATGEKRGARKRSTREAPADDGPSPQVLAERAIVAYTDGACSGNPGPAGLGVVVLRQEHRVERSEYLGTGTNNIAELTAILRAVEISQSEPLREHAAAPLIVHTDSKYAIGVLTKGWRAKANQELIARLRDAIAARPKTRLVYVPGHSGVELNERADELARLAVSSRSTSQRAVRAAPAEAVSSGVEQ